MLIDTDVLIWLFRGRDSARKAIADALSVELSAVTYMELVQGMRNKLELQKLRRSIHEQRWSVLPISENISHRACIYVENYALSHGIRLADALIASTAAESGSTLMTANIKHYKVISEVSLMRFKP